MILWFCEAVWMLQVHRIMWVVRVFRRSLVQPLEQSKVNCGQTKLCRALSNRSLKGWHWHKCSTAWLMVKMFFLMSSLNLSFQFIPVVSCPSLHAHWVPWLNHFDNLPVGTGRLLLGLPQSHLLLRLKKPHFLSISSQTSAPAPSHPSGSAELAAIYWCLLWGPKPVQYSRCDLRNCEEALLALERLAAWQGPCCSLDTSSWCRWKVM